MTPSSTIKIASSRIIAWMNVLRDSPEEQRYRLLECFWETQITSKAWLINVLKSLDLKIKGDVYIFGGWYGILASLIKDELVCENVYSVDVDETCQNIGSKLDGRIKFITADMKNFTFPESNVGLVINTSTEHVTQHTFDMWLSSVPTNVPIVLQGNDFFNCSEHVRCAKSLEQFAIKNPLEIVVYESSLDCKQFTRFMIIGYKNAI